MKPGPVLIFCNCSSLTAIDFMMSPSILGGSLTKLLVAQRPRRPCHKPPSKAEPSSQSRRETRTGKQKRKAILRFRCKRFRILSSRAKTLVQLGPRDPDALPSKFHGGIPRLALGMTARARAVQIWSGAGDYVKSFSRK